MKSHFIGNTSTAPSTTAVNYNNVTANFSASWGTTEITRGQVVPHAMTLDQLRVILTTAPGLAASGKKYNITLMVNGVASALTCDILETATTGQDLSHTVTLAAGDYISLRFTPTGTPTAPGISYWTIRQDATGRFASIGANIGAPTAGTNFLPPQNRALVSSTDALGQMVMPTAGVLKNLYVWARSAPGAATAWTFNVVLNGSTQALGSDITGVATSGNDTGNTVTVAAGDTISVQIAVTGTPTSTNISWALTFEPTTDGESFLAYTGNGISPSTSVTNFTNANGHDNSWNATEANRLTRVAATTIKSLWVATSVSPGVSPKAYAITVRKETADTAAAVTITDASSVNGAGRYGSITGQSIAVNDDDRLSIKAIPTSTPSLLFVKTSILMYIAPPVTAPPIRVVKLMQAVNRGASF